MTSQGWTKEVAEKRGQKQNRVPPFAPSEKERLFYQEFIKKVSQARCLPKRVLILGATPETRDCSIKNGLETFSVDISKDMMEKLSKLMVFRKSSLNKEIINNWLKIDFPADYFGTVLADGSFTNLAAKEDNERLLKICSKILKKNGFLIMRQLVYPPNYKGYSRAENLVKDYRSGKISWEDFYMELRFLVFRPKVYNKKTYQLDSGRVHTLIDRLLSDNILTRKEHSEINIFRNNIVNSIYPEKEFIKLVENNGFKPAKTFRDKPFLFFNYLYLMVFVRK